MTGVPWDDVLRIAFFAIGCLYALILALHAILHWKPLSVIRVEPLPFTPDRLKRDSFEREAAWLAESGFAEIGCRNERVLGLLSFPTREFFHAGRKTYGSMMSYHLSPAVFFMTPFAGGSLLFTGVAPRKRKDRGKLVRQGGWARARDRLEAHIQALASLEASGARPEAKGTLEERIELSRLYYRLSASSGDL